MIKSQYHEQRKVTARVLGTHDEEHECVVGAICAARGLLSDITSFRVFYDLLPVVTREPDFRTMQVLSDPAGFDPRPSCAILEHLISCHTPGAKHKAPRPTSGAG